MRVLPVVALALAGCLKTAAFTCADQADCTRGGESGVCEPTGFCSFADATCDGGRRYGELSGSLANQCVGGVSIDAPLDDTPPPIDAPDGPPAAPFCDSAGDATLVGCWEFEGVLTDASGDGNNGTGTGVAFGAGVAGMAAQLGAASHIAVVDSASLTPTSITIEAWINVTTLPTGLARLGVLDNDGQYGLFVVDGGLSCTVAINPTAQVAITPGTFTHVACTYDAATGTGRLYLDGTQVAIAVGGTPLGAGNTNGAALGGNSPSGDTLVGSLDQMRIFTIARSAQQICTAAGKLTCP